MMEKKKLRSGDDCPFCSDGWLHVYCTRVEGNNRIRYLRCRLCKKCPQSNIEVVPLDRRTRERRKSRGLDSYETRQRPAQDSRTKENDDPRS